MYILFKKLGILTLSVALLTVGLSSSISHAQISDNEDVISDTTDLMVNDSNTEISETLTFNELVEVIATKRRYIRKSGS
jgi:hypothetical protein